MTDKKKPGNRNAMRSRFLIKKAYGELLNEKDPSKITVTDIVERANISRGTFYAHYLDVYDLNLSIQNNIINTLDKAITRIGVKSCIADPTACVKLGMLYLEEHKSYFTLFVNSSQGEPLISRIINYIEDKIYPILREMFSDNETEKLKLFVIYTVGAYKRVITAWFSGLLKMSAEECADLLLDIYMASRPPEIIKLKEENGDQ